MMRKTFYIVRKSKLKPRSCPPQIPDLWESFKVLSRALHLIELKGCTSGALGKEAFSD
jgi:hypothetical protein